MPVEHCLDELRRIVRQGGPEPEDYPLLDAIWDVLHEHEQHDATRSALTGVLDDANLMQGFAFQKPYGYAGDFEMIERIYQHWKSTNPGLRPWDEYFHQKSAPRAVRNRKSYFHILIREKILAQPDGNIHVLNVASGPARDIAELTGEPGAERLCFDCIELDPRAIEYASELTRYGEAQIKYHHANALKFTPERKYDLIWSAGLMDYLEDKYFIRFLARMREHLNANGEIVLGNFGPGNCSKAYMELVGDWFLLHRSRQHLANLAVQAGARVSEIRIDMEPERVNLFLRVAG